MGRGLPILRAFILIEKFRLYVIRLLILVCVMVMLSWRQRVAGLSDSYGSRVRIVIKLVRC